MPWNRKYMLKMSTGKEAYGDVLISRGVYSHFVRQFRVWCQSYLKSDLRSSPETEKWTILYNSVAKSVNHIVQNVFCKVYCAHMSATAQGQEIPETELTETVKATKFSRAAVTYAHTSVKFTLEWRWVCVCVCVCVFVRARGYAGLRSVYVYKCRQDLVLLLS